jgi:hypothetical protein
VMGPCQAMVGGMRLAARRCSRDSRVALRIWEPGHELPSLLAVCRFHATVGVAKGLWAYVEGDDPRWFPHRVLSRS